MAKDNDQGKQPKPQTSQGKKLSINESMRNKVSGDTGDMKRSRNGTAGDGNGSTGPRKTE